ncbi:Response regulator [Roseovarius mucosus DSM 17069]|uniref:Response regulator n=1 Tax=Roseovarius mucosus DSM 17069 TaxID=1288298 RepID=A0A0A0HI59_9RHOB|nr:response regulator transcription factor [Roseovarius mucosus]KGM86656.1 Response regulator [Roseovarius mucosus DSM 17069]MAN99180.1 helix-turn-helix transcriptional regulator [Roseovarius sp.]
MKQTVSSHPVTLVLLIAVQSFCAAFFLWDVASDLAPDGVRALAHLHLAIETGAALALLSAIVFEARYLMALLRRKAHLEEQVSIATGAFHDIILAHFDRWTLTPAERDVAMFAIKGFSVTETAELRGSAPGTVKAQLNAVYRKAGVSGRGALLGLLVDELLAGPLVEATPDRP